MTGTSNPPDPNFHAYRQDLADTALAGRVIASHYAEPLARQLTADANLVFAPSDASELVEMLSKGDGFELLDSTRGWAWGYGGGNRRVGYVRAEAVGAP